MCRVPGHERVVDRPDLTAAAGPVLAVDRAEFLALGGYDPIYFPGRIEDLDLGFRGWMAGWRGYYVPESVAYHRGFGSFGPALGRDRCDRLAIRNSLLFAWKNLAGARLAGAPLLAPGPARGYWLLRGRLDFALALLDALARLGRGLVGSQAAGGGAGLVDRAAGGFLPAGSVVAQGNSRRRVAKDSLAAVALAREFGSHARRRSMSVSDSRTW